MRATDDRRRCGRLRTAGEPGHGLVDTADGMCASPQSRPIVQRAFQPPVGVRVRVAPVGEVLRVAHQSALREASRGASACGPFGTSRPPPRGGSHAGRVRRATLAVAQGTGSGTQAPLSTRLPIRKVEPRRVSRRLQLLRGWSHDEAAHPPILLKSASVRSGWCWSTKASTARSRRRSSSIAAKIGCSGETLRNWVAAGRARPGPAGRADHGRARADQGAGAREPRAAPGQRDPAQGERVFCEAELDRRSKP